MVAKIPATTDSCKPPLVGAAAAAAGLFIVNLEWNKFIILAINWLEELKSQIGTFRIRTIDKRVQHHKVFEKIYISGCVRVAVFDAGV